MLTQEISVSGTSTAGGAINMAKIGLVGGSYQERSLPFDAQRTINLYPVADQKGGSEPSALYGTPGLLLFATAGTGPIRGIFTAANNRVFTVSGSVLYEVLSNGSTTNRGSLNTSSGIVTISENGFQLGICDGDKVYIFTYATNVFGIVTDTDLPSCGGIDFIDGYFVVNQNNSGKFFISALNDGTSWDPLDFATAESSPDKLNRAINFLGQLGLFGSKSLEIWRDSGASLFPFTRISGAAPIGSVAPYTILSIDTSIYWVGSNDQGQGIVYKANGFSPTRISTSPIEEILQRVEDPSLLRSWTYQDDGHPFYVITGENLETSLVYDLSTDLWHERAYLNSQGDYEQHLGSCCVFAFGDHLVGSRRDGKLYRMMQEYFSDDGEALQWKRVYTHIEEELKLKRRSRLQIFFEAGVGLQSGQGSDPVCSLRISQDGAKTWSNFFTNTIGKVGQYNWQTTFRRLGIQQQCTFELSGSDPCKRAIIGSFLT